MTDTTPESKPETDLLRERCIEIARNAARPYHQSHPYLKVENFVPHEWVIDAIAGALEVGKREGMTLGTRKVGDVMANVEAQYQQREKDLVMGAIAAVMESRPGWTRALVNLESLATVNDRWDIYAEKVEENPHVYVMLQPKGSPRPLAREQPKDPTLGAPGEDL